MLNVMLGVTFTLSASRKGLDDEDFAIGGDAVGERLLVAQKFIAKLTPPPAPPRSIREG